MNVEIISIDEIVKIEPVKIVPLFIVPIFWDTSVLRIQKPYNVFLVKNPAKL